MLLESLLIAIFAGIAGIDLFNGLFHIHRPIVTGAIVGLHIAGAINIPNEEIGHQEIEELPDKNQPILVYCRSGHRSKQASSKLAVLGYKNIYEFGGVITWEYGLVE